MTKILVFGYHEVGFQCLDALIEREEDVVGVVTHEDDAGETNWFGSVADLAHQHGIQSFTPKSVNDDAWLERLRPLEPDLIFSFYYRNMIRQDLLNLAPLGAFNMHGSLLPKYRGCAPVNWAVLHGETKTGVSLHAMVKKADAGDVIDQEDVAIGATETAGEVMEKIAPAARKVLMRQIDALKKGCAPHSPQDESAASYFGRRGPEDGRINWSQPSQDVFNLVRAVAHPYPGAFSEIEGRKLLIWRATVGFGQAGFPGEILSASPLRVATKDGFLEITRWQWQGSAVQNVGDVHGLSLGAKFELKAA
jgi:methionyl-tRNA formyltransferase